MRNASKSMITLLAAAGLAMLTSAAYAVPPGAGPCGYGGGPGMGRWGGGPGPMAGAGGPGLRGGYGPGARAGYGPGAGVQPGAGPAANAEARLNALKGDLKITESQQAAWDAYAATVRERAGAMLALRTQAAAPQQSAPDRIAQRSELMKQRAAGMEAMSAATTDLYAVLTPEQQAIADRQLGGMRVAQAGPRGYGPGQGPRGYGPRR